MKRVISLVLLLMVIFLGFELIVNKLTKTHTVSYTIKAEDIEFKIEEEYIKKNGNSYNLAITSGDKEFYFNIKNEFNKEKKIVKDIKYFKDGNNLCIYPVLRDKKEAYILCNSDNNLYTKYSYSNQGFINEINNKLIELGLITTKENESAKTKNFGNIVINTNKLKDDDTVIIWQYKGIYIINNDRQTNIFNLGFDKYDNKLGCLAGKYYVIPNYTNKNVLEFSSVTIINLETYHQSTANLGYTLSSDTYVNGVVDGKIYYMDPSNLIQIKFNPKNDKVELIGNEEMGGQVYDGNWKDVNIYELKNNQISFMNKEGINYSYKYIKESDNSYYFYTSEGNIYQLVKGHLDKPILLYKANGLNNFNVVGDDIYYVINDSIYDFSIMNGNIKVLTDNDLIYNTHNRVSIYRKK